MLKTIIATMTVTSLCLLIVLLNVTTPVGAGPFGILSIFIFAYMLSLGLMAFFLFLTSRLYAKLSASLITKKPMQPMSFRHAYYYSTILAVVPILLIGLQSVGSIGFYEVSLLVIFVVIGCLYISKKVQ